MQDRKLLLVDGMAVIYRAYFAIKGLSTSSGHPTNALYGFIRIIEQLRSMWAPTHWAVVFDGGLPEDRTTVLETYKAQREPMPDPLEVQLESIDEYLEAAGIPWFMMEGQEADDVIASIATQAAQGDCPVLIATSDKDLFQVVDERIQIVSPSKKAERMGIDEVRNKTGVTPDLMIAWQALVGDTVDNIPGIPGVGPKTAAKWLNQYGSIEGLYAHLEELKPERFRSVLQEQRGTIDRNLSLVHLRTDLSCPVDWPAIEVGEAGRETLLPFLEKYELHSMIKNLTE